MNSKPMRYLSQLGCAHAVFAAMFWASTSPGVAQITPDATLPTNSVVNQNGNIFTITGGSADVGGNLFHSFSAFSLPNGTAFFNNPATITNIISRVTGGTISNINGTLQTNAGANLFFINPSGIIFGPNARLNVGGSFVASTADRIQFANGSFFSATNPTAPPLLTVNVPLGVQYGANPGSVQVQGSTLQVNPGQSLALLGGPVSVNGGRLFASGGRIELGGVAAGGNIGLNVNGNSLLFNFPQGVPRTDVAITNGTQVDVRTGAAGGGSIGVNANTLNITGAATRMRAGIIPGSGAIGTQAGDIDLNATQAINIDGGVISNLVWDGSIGNSGNINISTGSLSLTNSATLNASTFGVGDAGKVNITATDTVSLAGSYIFNNVGSTGIGNSGGINITTGSLLLTEGAQLDSSTFGVGNGGNVKIAATGTVSLDGTDGQYPTAIFSTVATDAQGKGGTIEITTGSLSLTNEAQLDNRIFGVGDTGQVNITATDTISLAGSYIYNAVRPTGKGNSGGINITTGSLLLTEGAQMDSSTFGQGIGGNVKINATGTVSLDGSDPTERLPSAVFSTVGEDATGKGGNIEINAGSVSLTNGARLSATTFGVGDAGSVKINATGTVSLDGTSPTGKLLTTIFSTVEQDAEGKGGNIDITSGSVSITNNARLNASTSGQGDGGNVTINAADTVSLAGGYVFNNVGDTGEGKGGDINITTGSVLLTNGAQLQTRTLGLGDGGSVKINAAGTVSLDGSSSDERLPSAVFSTVGEDATGKGGSIEITTGSVSLTNGAQLSASTFGQGDAGIVKINATDTVSLDGVSPTGKLSTTIFSTAQEEAVGNAGGIDITTGSLLLSNGGQLQTRTLGQGNAGIVKITATGIVSLDGTSPNEQLPSAVFSTVNEGAVGNGGGIDITAGSVSLTNGARLIASTFGQGDAGNVRINATDRVSLDGTSATGKFTSAIYSTVELQGVGNAGGIDISTDSLSLTNGGVLVASTFARGDAGNVRIKATDTISIDGVNPFNPGFTTGVFSTVESNGVGNGGSIDITTKSLSLTNAGQLQTVTRGQGDAGNIKIRATDTVSLDGTSPNGQLFSGVFSAVGTGSVGNGGNIDITTESLSLNKKATLNASNLGTGNAGTLTVVASDSIRLNNESKISADTNGGGGNINLNSPLILLRRNSDISTNADGTNNTAGNINIDTTFLVAIPKEDSDITADSPQFRGGTVTVNASGGVFGLKFREQNIPESSDITAKGRDSSLSGTVTLNTPIVDPAQGLGELPVTVTDPSNQIAVGCAAARGNSFTVTGRGGLPEDPTGTIRGQTVWRDLQDFSQETGVVNAPPQNPQALMDKPSRRLVEANTWVRDEKGNVVLLATGGNETASTYRSKPPQCQDLSSSGTPKN